MPEVVLVKESILERARATLEDSKTLAFCGAPADEAQLAEAVRAHNCRMVVLGTTPYRGPLYEALAEVAGENPALMARFGVGHDSVDKALAARHNIVVANTPGVLTDSVAELAMAMLAALARRLPANHAEVMGGGFSRIAGGELRGKRLGVIGFGAIGQRVAEIAAMGYGMEVCAVDSVPSRRIFEKLGISEEEGRRRYGLVGCDCSIDDALAQCDFITLHVSGGGDTESLMNAERLARCKPGACLVNTARGSVIDEGALYDALESGRLGGAALDVYRKEPYEPAAPGKDLRTLGNVLLTPHIGSNTEDSNRRMARVTVENIRHFMAGEMDKVCRV